MSDETKVSEMTPAKPGVAVKRPAASRKLVIPSDRSQKQPLRFFCNNPECLESSLDHRFEFEGEEAVCPKCGANEPPLVGLLVLIHLLVSDVRGPVRGQGGMRYRIACDPTRAHLATATNHEQATSMIGACNCPGCLFEADKQKLAHMSGFALVAKPGD